MSRRPTARSRARAERAARQEEARRSGVPAATYVVRYKIPGTRDAATVTVVGMSVDEAQSLREDPGAAWNAGLPYVLGVRRVLLSGTRIPSIDIEPGRWAVEDPDDVEEGGADES